jgi:HD-GYP domain-containing protein (c-di-GMP phosphodiesterase class II)
MEKKVIKLTENELTNIIMKIVTEAKKEKKEVKYKETAKDVADEINKELRAGVEVREVGGREYVVFPKRYQSVGLDMLEKLVDITDKKIGFHSTIPGRISIKF